jgi:hypothetical protein
MDALVSTSVAGAYKPLDFTQKVGIEHELAQLGNPSIRSGREWAGESFNQSSNALTFTTGLPGFVSTKSTLYRFAFFSSSTSIDSFVVQENGSTLGSHGCEGLSRAGC